MSVPRLVTDFQEYIAAIVAGIGGHLGFRQRAQWSSRPRRAERERALLRMTEVVERARGQRRVSSEGSVDLSRYALPIGLNLDHARSVIAAARAGDPPPSPPSRVGPR